MRLGRALGRGRSLVRGEHALAAAFRLAQPPHDEGEHERRQREDDEGGAPRERGDVAGHREADAGADVLAGEDHAVDPPALPAPEPVADERGDHRAGRGRDGAEEEPRPEQLGEVRGGGAPEHRDAPGHDRHPEHARPRHPVGQDAERQRRNGADEGADRDQQADVGVRDVQARPELARRRADGRGIGAAQPEDRGEDDDDAGALRASERDREAARGAARRRRAQGGSVGQDALGARLLGAHALMVAGDPPGRVGVPRRPGGRAERPRSGSLRRSRPQRRGRL